MFCSNCGNKLGDEANFCGFCGSSLIKNRSGKSIASNTINYKKTFFILFISLSIIFFLIAVGLDGEIGVSFVVAGTLGCFIAALFSFIYKWNEERVISVSPKEKKELDEQVLKYDSLSIMKSERGKAVLWLSGLVILSLTLAFFKVVSADYYGALLYVPLIYFIYRGSKGAMYLTAMIFTVDKGYIIVASNLESGRGVIMQIVWWIIIIGVLFQAIQVEKERERVSLKI